MTMLDRMRRHQTWLKWSLAPLILAFGLLYAWKKGVLRWR